MNEMNERILPEFEDIALLCADCNRNFIFGIGEQQFFWSKGLAKPKRCKTCRAIRKATIVSDRDVYDVR
jgi:hypothetical protein